MLDFSVRILVSLGFLETGQTLMSGLCPGPGNPLELTGGREEGGGGRGVGVFLAESRVQA